MNKECASTVPTLWELWFAVEAAAKWCGSIASRREQSIQEVTLGWVDFACCLRTLPLATWLVAFRSGSPADE